MLDTRGSRLPVALLPVLTLAFASSPLTAHYPTAFSAVGSGSFQVALAADVATHDVRDSFTDIPATTPPRGAAPLIPGTPNTTGRARRAAARNLRAGDTLRRQQALAAGLRALDDMSSSSSDSGEGLEFHIGKTDGDVFRDNALPYVEAKSPSVPSDGGAGAYKQKATILRLVKGARKHEVLRWPRAKSPGGSNPAKVVPFYLSDSDATDSTQYCTWEEATPERACTSEMISMRKMQRKNSGTWCLFEARE